MGNCLKSTSTDDLTLLNGGANRDSIDQDPTMHFQVRFAIFWQRKREKIFLLRTFRNLPLF